MTFSCEAEIENVELGCQTRLQKRKIQCMLDYLSTNLLWSLLLSIFSRISFHFLFPYKLHVRKPITCITCSICWSFYSFDWFSFHFLFCQPGCPVNKRYDPTIAQFTCAKLTHVCIFTRHVNTLRYVLCACECKYIREYIYTACKYTPGSDQV